MRTMAYIIATRYWTGFRECVRSWWENASEVYPTCIAPNMNIVEAFQYGYERTTEPILAMIHDDVMIYEKDWDLRVLKEFEDPTVGLVGFGGALGHGNPQLYKVPFHLPDLARQSFMSNMRTAEIHGQRFAGERDVAVLDGFALFVLRSVLDKWGGWPQGVPVDYFMYAENLCCEVRRQGMKIRLVGVDCEHLGGKTVGMVPLTDDYQNAHKYFYEHNRDVMPFMVSE